MTVHYVPRSADAAIAGTHKDMKFKNTFDTPIYIEGKANVQRSHLRSMERKKIQNVQ